MGELIHTLVWAACHLLICVFADFAARWFSQRDEWPSRVFHVCVIYVGFGVLTATALGTGGGLTSFGLRITNALLVILGLIAIGYLKWNRLPACLSMSTGWKPMPLFRCKDDLVLFGAIVVLVAHALYAIGRLPTEFDCLMYHMPFMDHWLQAGTLTTAESARWSTPANCELLGVWITGAFSGDFLVPLNNLPIVLVWLFGTFELGLQCGLGYGWRSVAALATIATVETFRQTGTAENDLMVAAFYIAGLAYLMRYLKWKSSFDAVLFSVCLGLLAGTKFFALGYASVLFAVWKFVVARSQGWKATFKINAFIAVGCGIFGGYWYLRNLIMTGYPLFPMGSPKLHHQILYPDLWATTLAFNGHPQVVDLLLDAVWRHGGVAQFIAIGTSGAVALLTAFSLVPARDETESDSTIFGYSRDLWVIIGLATLGSLMVWLVTPMLVEDQPETLNHLRWGYTPVRYGLSFLSVAVMGMMNLGQTLAMLLPSRFRSVFVVLVGGLVIWQFLDLCMANHRNHVDLMALIAFDVSVVFLILRFVNGNAKCRFGFCLTGIVGCTMLVSNISQRWHRELPVHFDRFYGTSLFSEFAILSSQRVVVLDDRTYAFFGSRRQHTVIHPELFIDLESVRRLCLERDADWVIVRDDPPQQLYRYRGAAESLRDAPGFTLEGEGIEMKWYRVLK
jgi:hypothetical protein